MLAPLQIQMMQLHGGERWKLISTKSLVKQISNLVQNIGQAPQEALLTQSIAMKVPLQPSLSLLPLSFRAFTYLN